MVISYWLSVQPILHQAVRLITNNSHLITAAQNQKVLQAAHSCFLCTAIDARRQVYSSMIHSGLKRKEIRLKAAVRLLQRPHWATFPFVYNLLTTPRSLLNDQWIRCFYALFPQLVMLHADTPLQIFI